MTNGLYKSLGLALAGMALAASIGCAPNPATPAKPVEPEFVVEYQKGATQIKVYGAGLRSSTTGLHPRQFVKYSTSNDGKTSNIEITCETYASFYNSRTGEIESGVYIPIEVKIDGEVGMYRPLETKKENPKDIGYIYYGTPNANGANNANSLDDVAKQVCAEAAGKAYVLNQENAKKAKIDLERQISDNTNKVKPY